MTKKHCYFLTQPGGHAIFDISASLMLIAEEKAMNRKSYRPLQHVH